MNNTAVIIVAGVALTVVSILTTMIWTIREMYIHEARFADSALFCAMANAGAARQRAAYASHLAQAKHALRISEEFMVVAGRHSDAGALLLMTVLILAATTLSAALASLYQPWPFVSGTIGGLALVTFALAALAVFNTYGRLRWRPVQSFYRRLVKILSPALPFLAHPHPTHWPEIQTIILGVRELAEFQKDVYETEPLARQILDALAHRPRWRD